MEVDNPVVMLLQPSFLGPRIAGSLDKSSDIPGLELVHADNRIQSDDVGWAGIVGDLTCDTGLVMVMWSWRCAGVPLGCASLIADAVLDTP